MRPVKKKLVQKFTPVISLQPRLMEQMLILRRRMGWSQVEIAARLGFMPRTYIAWESGYRKPNRNASSSMQAFIILHERESEAQTTVRE